MRVVADSHAIVWYVQGSPRLSERAASALSAMVASPKVDLHPIDVAVADAAVLIPRDALGDPWDRFILATAQALQLPLVTRDGRIQKTELVETVW